MASNPNTAPPAGKPSSRMLEGLRRIAQDQDQLAAIAARADASEWFDRHSPGTRKARALTRKNFEACIKQVFGKETVEEIWNQETFIDYTKQFLDVMNILSPGGKVGKKPKAGVLWAHMASLKWWAVRFIGNFGAIYPTWQSKVTSHIHLVARTHDLEKGFHAKNNLTDTELLLFYRQLITLHQGVDD
ncbi:uncharacterized protein LTR77_007950 [Saxophila tyrrhenica]|uniref:Uncharacterized protein n=1 Tax=Saxophila tyrrhenica TaxID=1690608 RepID=A0AAV9P7I1_9PEZI|nr:hypothetical protein LTR77_007950 [Saxophila tyrrhenica]